LAIGFLGSIALAESTAPPKLPVANSEINPDAEVDPNDPILPVYEKADVVLDTIIVIGDRWVNPSNTDLRGFLNRSPNGYGVRELRASEIPRNEKNRICTNIKAIQTILKCSTAARSSPNSVNDLYIPEDYSTRTFWDSTIRDFATSLYRNPPPTLAARESATSDVFRAAAATCNQESRCVREVYRYFGVSTVSLPDIPIIGNINDFINQYLSLTPSGSRFENSEMGRVVDSYGKAQYCEALNAESSRNRCP
jgi:hypothetical protein